MKNNELNLKGLNSKLKEINTDYEVVDNEYNCCLDINIGYMRIGKIYYNTIRNKEQLFKKIINLINIDNKKRKSKINKYYCIESDKILEKPIKDNSFNESDNKIDKYNDKIKELNKIFKDKGYNLNFDNYSVWQGNKIICLYSNYYFVDYYKFNSFNDFINTGNNKLIDNIINRCVCLTSYNNIFNFCGNNIIQKVDKTFLDIIKNDIIKIIGFKNFELIYIEYSDSLEFKNLDTNLKSYIDLIYISSYNRLIDEIIETYEFTLYPICENKKEAYKIINSF